MGLFKFLKEKFAKKNNVETNTYVKGMEKSRANFASKLDELSLKNALFPILVTLLGIVTLVS